MPVDDDLAELEGIIKALRFADSDGSAKADLARARLLLANLRVHIQYLREQLGEAP